MTKQVKKVIKQCVQYSPLCEKQVDIKTMMLFQSSSVFLFFMLFLCVKKKNELKIRNEIILLIC